MKSPEHAQARNLFFQTDLSQGQIATLIGISQKTLSLWSKEGHWRKLKRLSAETPAAMIDEMFAELARINCVIRSREPDKQFATIAEAEVRRKIMASIKYLNDRQSAGTHVEVLSNFTTYVLARNLDHAKLITQYADTFLKGEKLLGSDKYQPYGLSDMLSDEDLDPPPTPETN